MVDVAIAVSDSAITGSNIFCAMISNVSHTYVVSITIDSQLQNFYAVNAEMFETKIVAKSIADVQFVMSDDASSVCFVFGLGVEFRIGCHDRLAPWLAGGEPMTYGEAISTGATVKSCAATFVPNSTVVRSHKEGFSERYFAPKVPHF